MDNGFSGAPHSEPKPTDLHYGHPRMALGDRAKIFIPFDPLKGFREALEEQERMARERMDERGGEMGEENEWHS